MGGSNSHELAEKHVVIIGGGYGGMHTAIKLKGKCRITMIDPKDGLHVNFASPRACVEPGFARKTFIPYAPVLGEIFKKGWVQEIKVSEKCVVLEEGQEIAYDFLVIATGTKGDFPGKIKRETSVNEAIAQYDKQIELIKSAQKITVIGGGASGTEMAGEIAVDYPKKEVTLVHSSEVLVSPLMGQSFRDKVRSQLQSSGVKLVLGEKVTNLSELPVDGSAKCVVKTDKGSEIEADLVFISIGLKVNSDAYSKALGDCMDETGSLKVRPTLQVEGHDNIFAVGDCANIDKMKMAYKADLHSGVVAKNIQALATSSSLKNYVEGSPMMIVTVGRTGGAFQVGPFVFGRRIVRNIKGRDMFVGKSWSDVKLKLREENLIGNKN